jgi:hypothetical protein
VVLSQVVFIEPEKMKTGHIRLAILNELRKQGTATRKEFEKTTKHWEGDKPRFESIISLAGGLPGVVTDIKDKTSEGALKWFWLNDGTSLRWAVMSDNWESKTSPGTLSTGRGAGFVRIRGRGRMRARGLDARPGIEARGWTELIQEARAGPFEKAILGVLLLAQSKIFVKKL